MSQRVIDIVFLFNLKDEREDRNNQISKIYFLKMWLSTQILTDGGSHFRLATLLTSESFFHLSSTNSFYEHISRSLLLPRQIEDGGRRHQIEGGDSRRH
jgi:hypothetical protein